MAGSKSRRRGADINLTTDEIRPMQIFTNRGEEKRATCCSRISRKHRVDGVGGNKISNPTIDKFHLKAE